MISTPNQRRFLAIARRADELRYLSLKYYWGKFVPEWEELQVASVIQIEHGCIISVQGMAHSR